MKKASWAALGGIALVAVVLVVTRVPGAAPQTDEQQILTVVETGRSAIDRRDIRSAFSLVSADYHDQSGNNVDRLHALVSQAFRSHEGFEAAVADPRVSVNGDEATATVRVQVMGKAGGSTAEVFGDQVTLTLRREGARRWLILPTKVWRLVSISGLPSGMDTVGGSE